jgi:hypothetical protein
MVFFGIRSDNEVILGGSLGGTGLGRKDFACETFDSGSFPLGLLL